jgi:hypothetical protein
MSIKSDINKKYKNTIDNKRFSAIIDEYHKFMMQKVFEGHTIFLPNRFGCLFVVGKKQQVRIEEGKILGLAPDWVSTKKLWDSNPEAKANRKVLYHENAEEDGYRYRFFWSKRNIFIVNKSLYSLRVSRKNKRTLHKIIKEEGGEIFKNK